MEVKTYRAGSMQEALALVRKDLGPDAAVLDTRPLGGGLLGRLFRARRVEVTASLECHVASRFAAPNDAALKDAMPKDAAPQDLGEGPSAAFSRPAADHEDSLPFESTAAVTPPTAYVPTEGDQAAGASDQLPKSDQASDHVAEQLDNLKSMVEALCRQSTVGAPENELPDALFGLYTDLIEADVSEQLARQLVAQLKREQGPSCRLEPVLLKARAAQLIEQEFETTGPIQVAAGASRPRLVALVGPTGVGKTTTIAKLAANFRIRDKVRVGLITVDTYRVAAVEQLRTYADIMDLPMEVVSTPREVRSAIQRLQNLDLVLMDTAGRSPRDEVKIQELKSMLAEARPDEVHLVISSVAGSSSLVKTAAQFAAVAPPA